MTAPRLTQAEKLAVAKSIVAKAQVLLHRHGKPEKISGHQFVGARIGVLKVVMATPFSGVKTGRGNFRYQVDIWQDGLGKVFGASWAPQERWANAFECYRLVKGDWIDGFLGRVAP